MAGKSEEKRKAIKHPEAKGLFLLAATLLFFISLFTFQLGLPSGNLLGMVGYGIGISCTYLFGLSSFLILAYAGWIGWQLLCARPLLDLKIKTLYFSLFLVSFSILLSVIAEHVPLPYFLQSRIFSESIIFSQPYPHLYTRYNLGGVPFYYLYRDLPTYNLQSMLHDVGTLITFSILAAVSFALLTKIKVDELLKKLAFKMSKLPKQLETVIQKVQEKTQNAALETMGNRGNDQIEQSLSPIKPLYKSKKSEEITIRNFSENRMIEEKPKEPKTKKQEAIAAQRVYNGDYTAYMLPPPALLTNPKKVDQPSLKKDLRRQAEILEETLLSFGIEAKVGEINFGPTITSFEVHPAVGVKVQKIKALESDIALKLEAKTIRIIAPIPGKAAVGVEIPSSNPQEVSFKEMLLAYQQSPRKQYIPILLGKTVTGDNVISDLSKMPHCLIAGATGSGKSVCINTIVMSILMNARPDEIKLLMVDPKKVELTSYGNLPHMIAPVITEAHGAYAALQWLVKEMQTRYEILKQLGMRNITAFNNRSIQKEFEESLSIPIPERMFAIVAIIDEFADLMMASSSDLETPIARIAQMARAVGIHLILATQRPSREVITGLIKANFPTRIAFKVASRINSQIIIDETGAESLLGNGDMLFLPPGSSHLMRAQGAYIRDEDINRVTSFITDQAKPNYLIPSFDSMPSEMLSDSRDEAPRDSLFDQAKMIVVDTQNASTTFLQRKLKIGYARAASLIDELEEKGVIGPQEGSKPRRILMGAGHEEREDIEN